MSNYKNPFEPGGKFYNPRITDASRVTEPHIMPRWVEQKQSYKTKFYDKDSGMLLEELDYLLQKFYVINKNEYLELKKKYNNSFVKIYSLSYFIITNSKTIRELILNDEEANVRAFLTTIRQTERGQSDLTPLPYNAHNGTTDGKLNLFTNNTYADAPQDYANHPGELNNQEAAGAYQFMASVWSSYVKKYVGLVDFSPFSQDKGAVCMLYDNRVLEKVKTMKIIDAKQVLLYNKQWTSFSAFTDSKIQELFNKNRIAELSYNSIIYTPFDFGLLDIQLK